MRCLRRWGWSNGPFCRQAVQCAFTLSDRLPCLFIQGGQASAQQAVLAASCGDRLLLQDVSTSIACCKAASSRSDSSMRAMRLLSNGSREPAEISALKGVMG